MGKGGGWEGRKEWKLGTRASTKNGRKKKELEKKMISFSVLFWHHHSKSVGTFLSSVVPSSKICSFKFIKLLKELASDSMLHWMCTDISFASQYQKRWTVKSILESRKYLTVSLSILVFFCVVDFVNVYIFLPCFSNSINGRFKKVLLLSVLQNGWLENQSIVKELKNLIQSGLIRSY